MIMIPILILAYILAYICSFLFVYFLKIKRHLAITFSTYISLMFIVLINNFILINHIDLFIGICFVFIEYSYLINHLIPE